MDESLNQCLKTCSKESSIPYFALLYSAYNLFMSLLSHNDVNKKIEKLKKEAEKDTFDRDKYELECDYLRRSYAQNIAFQIETNSRQFANLREQQAFKFFCERFWQSQFSMTINSLDTPRAELLATSAPENIKLQLLVAWTPALQQAASSFGMQLKDNYVRVCKDLRDRVKSTPAGNSVYSTSFISGWLQQSRSTLSDVMNLYYVMQGIPSVVLFLDESDGRLMVDVATWSLRTGNNNFTVCRCFGCKPAAAGNYAAACDLLYGSAAFAGDIAKSMLSGKKFGMSSTLGTLIELPQIRKEVMDAYSAVEKTLLNTDFKYLMK